MKHWGIICRQGAGVQCNQRVPYGTKSQIHLLSRPSLASTHIVPAPTMCGYLFLPFHTSSRRNSYTYILHYVIIALFTCSCVIFFKCSSITAVIVKWLQRGMVALAMCHVHVALSCLCSCMSNRTVPKYTLSDPAGAEEVYRAWGHYGALTPVKQTGFEGSDVLGHDTDRLVWVHPEEVNLNIRGLSQSFAESSEIRAQVESSNIFDLPSRLPVIHLENHSKPLLQSERWTWKLTDTTKNDQLLCASCPVVTGAHTHAATLVALQENTFQQEMHVDAFWLLITDGGWTLLLGCRRVWLSITGCHEVRPGGRQACCSPPPHMRWRSDRCNQSGRSISPRNVWI